MYMIILKKGKFNITNIRSISIRTIILSISNIGRVWEPLYMTHRTSIYIIPSNIYVKKLLFFIDIIYLLFTQLQILKKSKVKNIIDVFGTSDTFKLFILLFLFFINIPT